MGNEIALKLTIGEVVILNRRHNAVCLPKNGPGVCDTCQLCGRPICAPQHHRCCNWALPSRNYDVAFNPHECTETDD